MQQEQDFVPITLFYAYAQEDEHFCLRLEQHLSALRQQGLITEWHERKLLPGSAVEEITDVHLLKAQVILLLISPDFTVSDHWTYERLQNILERQARGETQVIPILLRPVDWKGLPFTHLQYLPRNGKPVSLWRDSDEALAVIARELRRLIEAQRISTGFTESPLHPSTTSPRVPSRTAFFHYQGHSSVQHNQNRAHVLRRYIFITVIMAILILTSSIFWFLTVRHSSGPETKAIRSVGVKNTYPLSTENQVFHDSLVTNNENRLWSEGSPYTGALCRFTAGAYHVSQSSKSTFASCRPSVETSYSNITFEVQMTILKGGCGGIVFRDHPTIAKYYLFEVCSDRTYIFYLTKGRESNLISTLGSGESSLINGGLNQLNTVAVMTIGSSFVFYVNHKVLTRISDSTYSEGSISLVADNYVSDFTEVAYNNATLWA